MKYGVEQLRTDKRFTLLTELEFGNMIPFVMEQIRKKSLITRLFWLSHLLLGAGIILVATGHRLPPPPPWKSSLLMSVLGFAAGSVVVIPFHEGLHAFTYYLLGARKIRLGADFRQMIFFITADRFVISGSGLALVALVPYIIISLLTCGATFLTPPAWDLFLLMFLLSHNLMCIGDFAMVNYVYRHRDTRLYTFDVIGEKKSYIYGFSEKSNE